MATTTTNFGWDIPQSTDLVKDGATAIAGLGQDIDTSMADLKGGTSGQILSKASNTDMDFTWVSPNPGDITGVTAGTGLTGGGTSGDVTVSFDVANYGGGQNAAGKNKIINGGFDIWQRGTSFTTSGAYTSDRWAEVNGSNSITYSRSTDVPSSLGFQYSISRAGIGSNMTQRIEAANAAIFAGQTATLSFYYKSTAGADNIGFSMYYANSADNFASLTQIGSNQTIATPATSWTRVTYSFSVPSGGANGLAFYFFRGNSATSTTLLTGVQLELGSTATPFSRAGGTIQGELAACYRYFQRIADGSGGVDGYITTALSYGTTAAYGVMQFIAPFRTNPTTTLTSGNFEVLLGSGSIASLSSMVFQNPTTTTQLIGGSTTGLTSGQAVLMRTGSTAFVLDISAEL